MTSNSKPNYIAVAQRTIRMELEAVSALETRINDDFVAACEIIQQCKGRVIVTGMGKSGHIGNKIASTLASTGTPAFFVHPGEASHGDLGMITHEDVVLAISNSGNSSEVLTLLPTLKHLEVPLISMTGNARSTLAEAANANLDISVACEACPLDLAPTSSSTVTLVMGDALAVALLEAKGFTAEDFAFSHPGGTLGKRLLLKVNDLMHSDSELPSVDANTTLGQALLEMTEKGLGMTTVQSAEGQLIGIFTDGDLRRSFEQQVDVQTVTIDKLMNTNPTTIHQNRLAAEALGTMRNNSITALVAIDDDKNTVGVIHMHDLLKAGIL